MKCSHCDYMRSIALPDHAIEIRNVAKQEAQKFGMDPISFADGVVAEFNTLYEHDINLIPWDMLAFVRRHTLAKAGVTTMREFAAIDDYVPGEQL